jgi:hypothetical protein
MRPTRLPVSRPGRFDMFSSQKQHR